MPDPRTGRRPSAEGRRRTGSPRQALGDARALARLPRALHPIAWWIWAVGLLVAVQETTNPLVLVLALAVLGLVVVRRRGEAPWARAFKYYLGLAGVVIVLRVIFQSVFISGLAPGEHVLVRLPRIPMPHWYAGVQIGGPVTLEGTLGACVEGLRLGVMLCCVGAANALANPKRALRVLPGALHELGVAVVVAISLAPQMVESAQRVARARRLRGGRRRGWRALASIAIPVLADALERSLALAAAMDSRGYGAGSGQSRRARRVTGALMLTGLLGLCGGCYGLLAADVPQLLGVALLGTGALLCLGGLYLGGRRVQRSRYRPDRWAAPEWLVAGTGVAAAAVMMLGEHLDAAALHPDFTPLAFPPLPLVPVLAVLVAALAGWLAPPPVLASGRGPASAGADDREPAAAVAEPAGPMTPAASSERAPVTA